jgi:hypothetical protein
LITEKLNIPEESPEYLEWSIHQARREPLKAVVTAIFIITVAIFIWIATLDLFLFILALIILIASVLPFYLPITYRLTDVELIIKTGWMQRRRPWSAFRRWEKAGLHFRLCTMAQPSRLDNYRSWLIRAKGSNKTQLQIFLENKIGPKHATDDKKMEK